MSAIQPRRLKHTPNPESVARAYRSAKLDPKLAQLQIAMRHEDAEAFGRQIGIFLHWLIIKPIQLMIICLKAVWWIAANAMNLAIVFFFGYLLWVVAYLIYLDHWN